MNNCIDLVIGGPDMSGTSTQIDDIVDFFQLEGKVVRDLRGNEIHALFHAQIFSEYNSDYLNLEQFLTSKEVGTEEKKEFIFKASSLLIAGDRNRDLKIASFLKNGVSTYIDPDSAEVWIMEEPTKRGAGQVNRTIEQQRTKYGSELDPVAAAYAHQAYRIDEFLRFRNVLRGKNKIIVRSRSEESACYQVHDQKVLPTGISREQYLSLPGHKIAFGNPPTHLFIVCASSSWTREEYVLLKKERSEGRLIDDHEANVDYQLLVNRRYTTNWLEELYVEGQKMYGAKVPEITRFDIYASKQQIKKQMLDQLGFILRQSMQV
ncbi:hypothetical protein GOV03_00790 [Candidatus Woesearchaeota archaeon]|nr:hypothetical protein [Candidatus Woesearchaeota archaeon]